VLVEDGLDLGQQMGTALLDHSVEAVLGLFAGEVAHQEAPEVA
jgi:hypothetical protein